MDLKLLATLKEKLIKAKDFGEVWTYFMDHFGENPKFIALGNRAHDPLLEAIITEVGRELFGKKVPLTNFLLTRLPEQQFLHGALTINGKLGNILYFEDVHMGLLTVVMSFSPSETKLIRFSGRAVPANPNPSRN
jgi:hypothetical protein